MRYLLLFSVLAFGCAGTPKTTTKLSVSSTAVSNKPVSHTATFSWEMSR